MRPILLSVVMIAAMGAENKQLNLPPGQYPGKPAENFAPAVKASSAAGEDSQARSRPSRSATEGLVPTHWGEGRGVGALRV